MGYSSDQTISTATCATVRKDEPPLSKKGNSYNNNILSNA